MGKKPAISAETYNLWDEDVVDKLIQGIGGLSSLYHKTSNEWNKEQQKYIPAAERKKEEEETVPEKPEKVERAEKKEKLKKASKKKQDSSDEEPQRIEAPQ